MNKKLWLEQHYWELREQFEDVLLENWYDPDTVDEEYHGREEFVNIERKNFKEIYWDNIDNY